MFLEIILPVISIAALALVFGGLLGFASKKFYVEVDPKVEQIQAILPGVNCGGCGLPGCGMFAQSVADGKANYDGCPVAGAEGALAIAAVLGIEASASARKVAFVMCNGIDDNVKRNYIYSGPKSCIAASQLALGGNKACTYACIGLASCKNVCPFDAVNIINSVSVIDEAKCTACGKCVEVCPKKLIEMMPEKGRVRVMCNSKDKGKVVRENCRAGCIGCMLCQKACEFDAVIIENNIAKIDYEKCTMCNACVGKCPTKAIKIMP